MQELLKKIDFDYYRSTRLLIARAEIEQLRQERPAPVDVETPSRPRFDKESGD